MPLLDLSPDELLTTTRSVRRRLDLERPVPLERVRECLEIAIQAPTGSNAQGWHFVVVTDAERRRGLAELYHRAFRAYRDSPLSAHTLARAKEDPDDRGQMERVISSAEYLAENLHRVPVHVIPCIEGRTDQATGPLAALTQASVFGSILPAAWSFMLAARARGLASAWTTLHLAHEKEAAELLGIPHDRILQAALLPVAWSLGTEFKPARRRPLDTVLHVDRW